MKFGISQKIAFSLAMLPATERLEFLSYIPFLNQVNLFNYVVLVPHIAEYFCDLFASQYIGRTSNYYLKYLTKNSINYSGTHPATTNRIQLVDNFISKTNDRLLDVIQQFTLSSSAKSLEIRYDEFSSNDFYSFIPVDINSPHQLHGIFNYGWNIYLNDWDNFKHFSGVEDLTSNQVYKIVNNLIEKSIGNYFINEDWKKSISLLDGRTSH